MAPLELLSSEVHLSGTLCGCSAPLTKLWEAPPAIPRWFLAVAFSSCQHRLFYIFSLRALYRTPHTNHFMISLWLLDIPSICLSLLIFSVLPFSVISQCIIVPWSHRGGGSITLASLCPALVPPAGPRASSQGLCAAWLGIRDWGPSPV